MEICLVFLKFEEIYEAVSFRPMKDAGGRNRFRNREKRMA